MIKLLKNWLARKKIPADPAKKKLFIHAGSYKTGTTFFQHMVYHNRNQLRAHGIDYPLAGLGLNTPHNRYAHRLLGLNLAAGRSNDFPAIIEGLENDDNVSTALVSYEGFSHPATISKLQEISPCFSTVELHGILAFRPHVDYALSLYRELCQHVNFTAPFQELMHPLSKTGRSWHSTLAYRNIVEGWLNLTSRDNLHILSYQRIKKDMAGCLIAPTGYKAALQALPEAERNVTLSAPLAILAQRLNRQKFKTVMRHRLAKELAALDPSFPHFSRYCEITPEQAQEWENSFADDRDFMQSWDFDPVHDLTASNSWRWGTETEMGAAVDEAHEALIAQLTDNKKPKMLEIAKAAWQQQKAV